VTLFDTNLVLVRTNTLPTSIKGPGGAPSNLNAVVVRAVLGDGLLLVWVSLSTRTPRPSWVGNRLGTAAYVVTDFDGRLIQLLAMVTLPHRCFLEGTGASRVQVSITIPFCNEQSTAVSPDGEFLAVAEDSLPVIGRPVMSLLVVRSSGDTVYNRSWEYERERIPRTDLDVERPKLEGQIAAMKSLGVELKPVAFPELVPPFEQLSIAVDGQVWISSWKTQAGRSLTRISARGVIIDRFRVTSATRAISSLQDAVWVESLNADDVPSLVGFRVVR
jgi:hypothetical protein